MRLSVIALALVVGLSLLAPVLAPLDPLLTNTDNLLQAPNWTHWLGTDELGRDVLSRVLFGGRQSLFVASAATALALGIGLLLGAVRWPGRGALLNALLAFPGLMIALVIITLMGRGYGAIVLATGLAQVAPVARVVSVAVASVESRDFVEAARGLGGTRWFIVWNHIFPTILPAVAAYASVTFGYCLLNSAALSFLGFSRTPELPDWGVMLKDGRAFVRLAPWISLAPGVLMTVTIAAVNDVTDSLTNLRR